MKLSGYVPWGPPRWSVVSRMTLSSKCPVRNHQRPPSTPNQGQEDLGTFLMMLEFWNLAYRLIIKCWEQIWGQGWPMFSMPLVRNPQCPPSHWRWQGTSWHTSHHARMLKFCTQFVFPCQDQFWGQGWPMSSMSPVRNPQCPSSHWWWRCGSWHTSNYARKFTFRQQVKHHI